MSDSLIAMNERPVLYQLIEAKLGEPLADFVGSRRPYLSWRQLAPMITAKTGAAVSHETLRVWFADESAVAIHPEPVVEIDGQQYHFIGRSTEGEPLYKPVDREPAASTAGEH